MGSYRLYQIDAFTSERFKGNPAGVVTNAQGLDVETMQHIAREMNCSESAFVLPSDTADADVWIRYFTPTAEVPVCGHATIAAHYALASERDERASQTIRTKTGAGILPIESRWDENDYVITMTQGKPELLHVFDDAEQKALMVALGISEADIDTRAPMQIASTGHSKVMVPITSAEVFHGLQPDMSALSELSNKVNCNGYFTFTFDTPSDDILTEGRMFAPAIGIMEDPVTGNANGPLGAYLVHHGLVSTDTSVFRFRGAQGRKIGRYGEMDVTVTSENGQPTKVQVAGRAVTVFQTSLEC